MSEAVIALNSPTCSFIALNLNGDSDPIADNQANRPDIELVGNDDAGLYAFYAQFNYDTASTTDGEFFYRVRVAGNQGQASLDGFVLVGLDITGDGALDYYISHGGNPSQQISIIRAGNGTNNSPTTLDLGDTLYSTAVNSFNSSFSAVDAYGAGGANLDNLDDTPLAVQPDGLKNKQVATSNDLNGGGDTDHFLTFSLDFNALVSVVRADATAGLLDSVYLGFDDTSEMQLLLTTSQNGQNINSDLGGIDGNSSTDPFIAPDGGSSSGGLTNPVSVEGSEVPELANYPLLLGLFSVLVAVLHRK